MSEDEDAKQSDLPDTMNHKSDICIVPYNDEKLGLNEMELHFQKAPRANCYQPKSKWKQLRGKKPYLITDGFKKMNVGMWVKHIEAQIKYMENAANPNSKMHKESKSNFKIGINFYEKTAEKNPPPMIIKSYSKIMELIKESCPFSTINNRLNKFG